MTATSGTLGHRLERARLDLSGVALFLALPAWMVAASTVNGGRPWAAVAVVLGVGLTLFIARLVTRVSCLLIPGALAVCIGLYLASFGHNVTANLSGPLGYKNAGAALAVVGVGAAGLVLVRARSVWVQVPAAALAMALLALPWASDVTAGRGTGAVVAAALVALLVGRAPSRRRVVLAMAAAVLVVLAATVTAGALYQGDGEGDRAGALTERRLVLWSEAAEMVAQRPLVGVGAGRFAEFSPTAMGDSDASWAHHEPLHVGAESGATAMVLVVAIVLWGLAWLLRGDDRPGTIVGAALLAAAFAHACVDYVWHFPVVPLALAAVVGAASTGASRPWTMRIAGGPNKG